MNKQEEQVYTALLQEFCDKLPMQRWPWHKVSGSDLSGVCSLAIAAVILHKVSASKMYDMILEDLHREYNTDDIQFVVGPRVFARVYDRAKELLNQINEEL